MPLPFSKRALTKLSWSRCTCVQHLQYTK